MDLEILRVRDVTIKNFRTFYGEKNPILFSTEHKKPVTVFHGTNARGKTTLLNSIHWCIYGKEKNDLDQKKTTSEGLVHSYAIDTLEPNESDEMFVKVTMENQNSDIVYQIERKIIFKKISNDNSLEWNDIIKATIPKSIFAKSETIFSYRDPDSNELIRKNDDSVIKDILENVFPEILSSYVLFDAELLKQFENSHEDKLIKNGIETITGLPILKTAIKNIHKVSSSITVANVSETAKFQEAKNKLERAEEGIERYIAQIKEFDENIDEWTKSIDEITKFLIEHDDANIQRQETELKEKKGIKKDLDDAVTNSKHTIKGIIFENITNLLLRDSYKITKEKFDKWTKAGRMPTYFTKQALQSLLDEKKCLCDRPLDEHNEEFRKLILEKIKSTFDSAISTELGSIKERISQNLEDTEQENQKTVLTQIKNLEEKISSSRSQSGDLTIRIKEIENNFDPKMHDITTQKQRERTELERNREKAIGDRGKAKNNLDLLKPKKDEFESNFKKMKKTEMKDEIAKNQTSLADFAEEIFKKTAEKLFKDFKDEVESETQKYFLKIAPQKEEFKGVRINDENFTMIPERADGQEKSISQGQAHALGLSYIAGIRSIMKKNYFFMVDSPFHNISQESKLLACIDIPKNLGSTQVAFFVTDVEYRAMIKSDDFGGELSSARDVLSKEKLVGKEYNLVDQIIGEIGEQKYRNTNIVSIGGK